MWLVWSVGCASSSSSPIEGWTLVSAREGTLAVDLPGPVPLDGPSEKHFELRSVVRVAAHTKLDLVAPKLGGPARLYVDGREAEPATVVAPGIYNPVRPQRWHLPPDALDDGTVELRLIVERHWGGADLVSATPFLIESETTSAIEAWVETANTYVAGGACFGLIQLCLVCLLVYALDRTRKPYLWFGIQGLTAAMYPLTVSGLLQPILGPTEIPLMTTALVVALLVSIRFTHSYFELPKVSPAWNLVLALGVLANLCAPGPYGVIALGVPVTVACIALVIVYQLILCARLVRRRRSQTGAWLLFVAWSSLLALAWPDMIAWLGWADFFRGARTGAMGLACFSLFQLLIFSHGHISSLDRSDALNEELQARVHQLEEQKARIAALNEDLRRKIAQRSEDLFEMLSASVAERGREDRLELEPGTVVEDRYEVLEILGSGGMASVYKVARVTDRLPFAMKVARERDPATLARIAREARFAASLEHPNVTRICDVDVSSEGFVYLVMELVEGRSLEAYRPRFGDPAWALPLLGGIARGIEALHDTGLVHRDLKPANVLLDSSKEGLRPKLTDFGISHESMGLVSTHQVRDSSMHGGSSLALGGASVDEPDLEGDTVIVSGLTSGGEGGFALTEAGLVTGTPRYMAPEVVVGGMDVSSGVDVFAFGVMAYEMLTGRYPFSESMLAARMARRPFQRPQSFSVSEARVIEPRVRSLVETCLRHDPAERPQARAIVAILDAVSEA